MNKFKIKSERTVYDGFFAIKKGVVQRKDLKGKTVEVEREMLERGDSVAVLLFEKDTNSILLTEQFRYPTHNKDGYLVEIAAGGIEEGESPESCAQRELMEELGYQVNHLEYVSHFYSTPGTASERIFLFYAEVDTKDKIARGGGDKNEQEDINLIKHPVSKIQDLIYSIKDAKSIIALQWFLLTKN